MGSKNITISDEAYEFLKGMKGDKSFSEVVLSFKGRREDVMSFAGTLKKADLDSVEKVRSEMREDWENR